MEKFNSLILKYNEINDKSNRIGWKVAKSEIAGNGIIAKYRFHPGEIIFVDKPLIVGPRSMPDQPLLCIGCYKCEDLRPCKRCSMYICSSKCEDSEKHWFECQYLERRRLKNNKQEERGKQLFRILTPLRCLQFDDMKKNILRHLHQINGPHQGLEVQLLKRIMASNLPPNDERFMTTCCKVLDANAYEIQLPYKTAGSIRGLYPMASVINHSCIPNTTHDFSSEFHMVIKAATEILPGEEITSTYAPLLLGTPARRHFLNLSKHFECKCSRCQDPSEFETYLSALRCRSAQCDGFLLPSQPLNMRTSWKCVKCNSELSSNKIAILQNAIALEISKFNLRFPSEILKLVDGGSRIVAVATKHHHAIIQLKFLLLKIIGYSDGYKWSELSRTQLELKKGVCAEIMEIVDKLSLGECTIRGVCLFELQQTNKELKIRDQNNENET